MIGLPIIRRLRTLAFAALALVVFGAIECPPSTAILKVRSLGKRGLVYSDPRASLRVEIPVS